MKVRALQSAITEENFNLLLEKGFRMGGDLGVEDPDCHSGETQKRYETGKGERDFSEDIGDRYDKIFIRLLISSPVQSSWSLNSQATRSIESWKATR